MFKGYKRGGLPSRFIIIYSRLSPRVGWLDFKRHHEFNHITSFLYSNIFIQFDSNWTNKTKKIKHAEATWRKICDLKTIKSGKRNSFHLCNQFLSNNAIFRANKLLKMQGRCLPWVIFNFIQSEACETNETRKPLVVVRKQDLEHFPSNQMHWKMICFFLF